MQLFYSPKNVFKTFLFDVLCIFISFLFFLQGSSGLSNANLELKVNVADSKTFTVSELYEEVDHELSSLDYHPDKVSSGFDFIISFLAIFASLVIRRNEITLKDMNWR